LQEVSPRTPPRVFAMSYSEDLDERISQIVSTWENIGRKKMFGGVHKDYLIL
jgi:hypothetical protein